MADRGSWTELGKEKVLSSGITSAQAKQLGMYEVASAAKLDKSFDPRPALVLPYHGLDGKPMASHPRWPNFYRIRYLGKEPAGFKEAAGEKPQRYAQPPSTGVCAYMPPCVGWKQISQDAEYDIIITEGELKAAAACLQGFPTIGLGGVWNFRAGKEGVWFLPELEKFDWARRAVFICFDSDYMEKPNICAAINALCEELQERGAMVRLLTLPDSDDGKKVGLDDYLLQYSADDLKKLLKQAQPLGMTSALWKMNSEVVYVENPGLIVVEETGQKMSADAFKGHSRWATENTVQIRVSAKGDVIRDKVPAAPVWTRWPMRRSVRSVTYAPGQERFTEDGNFNQWNGWGTSPVKGDVTPWLKLTKYLFSEEPAALEYFYDWCAYPIQNPGTKMFTGVVIHGLAQGTGKTLVGYTLGRIYGENFTEIEDDDLDETFWAENKQFILGDEITGKDNRQYMNKLKRLITKSAININVKYVPQYTLPNCMNFLFTSQHGDSFFLEDKDRRFLVVEVISDPLPEKFYMEYDKWYKGDGAAHLMQWLLDRKITKDFNPSAAPPRTKAKDRMIASTKGDVESWVRELREFPNQVLRTGQMRHTRDLFSSRELLALYSNNDPNTRLTAVGLGRKLSEAGFRQVCAGAPLKAPDGRMERFFAIRNPETWLRTMDKVKLEKHLTSAPVRG